MTGETQKERSVHSEISETQREVWKQDVEKKKLAQQGYAVFGFF